MSTMQNVVRFLKMAATIGSHQKTSGTLFRRAFVPLLFAQQHSAASSFPASAKMKTNITKNLELWATKYEGGANNQLVVLLSWLMAKKRHLQKYNMFYNKQGFDVLCVEITPWQLLWPVTGTQLIAKDVLNFLSQQQQYKNIVIHGFSVGAYLYGEVLLHILQDRDRYKPITDKIVGQIFDSAVDFDGIPRGMPNAITKNKVLRTTLEAYVRTHMKLFYNVATKHYLRSSDIFHNNFVHTPALFLFSKTDPVGTAEGNLRVIRKWEMNGLPIYAKCWESSPHVSHFHHHPDEYLEELSAYLNYLGLLAEPHRRASKL